ncbi:hypothetical protein FNH22_12595 [Fulvivirga sp. M361]|uniref:hypothetical protein n=1 Tax=Fulvivirga sp. M361 TaxID=2594266 RepID=UPI00117AA152|nr:hypothetical protein [Fulvivirga sp. M361]TRX58710.1 hypothetical protein FNH22_12595 [Fulvivirga sp. M361]
MEKFLNAPQLKLFRDKAQEIKASGKRFSDVEDAAGHQFVDLVQEGGGVLGIALAGYTYILESTGIRFLAWQEHRQEQLIH